MFDRTLFDMAGDRVSATALIDAPAEAIFAVLADPGQHAAIDGTGCGSRARPRATAPWASPA